MIEDLKCVVFRVDETDPLYGGQTLSEATADVDARVATFRLYESGRSIWEIVLHAVYWRREVAHMTSNGKYERFSRGPEEWPALPQTTNESTWRLDRDLLVESEQDLLAAIDTITAESWSALPRNGGEWTLGQIASGVMAHDAYHIGQVMLLKKAAHAASRDE